MYSDYTDIDLYPTLAKKKEFDRDIQSGTLKSYQKMLSNFIHPLSHYTSLLLFHGTGTGKTITSLAISINFLKYSNYKIFIAVKNGAIKKQFETELHTFFDTTNIHNTLTNSIVKIKKNLKVDTYNTLLKKRSVNNHIIIIDEIHNITNNDMYYTLHSMLQKSVNIKLLLLSATPIFDNVLEIFEISNLLNFYNNPFPTRGDLISSEFISTSSKLNNNKLLDVSNTYNITTGELADEGTEQLTKLEADGALQKLYNHYN